MGIICSPCRRNNSVNEQVKLSSRQNTDKHEAPKHNPLPKVTDSDAKIEDSHLSAEEAANAYKTPSASRKENGVKSIHRKDEVPNTTKTEVDNATEKDRQKIREYERQLEQLEAEVITLRQGKDILANSDNSRIKNKDENHARGLANNGNKLIEYEKMIESLEADVMKLRNENETLLNRKDEVPNTTKTEINNAKENNRQTIHEYERQLEQLEAEVITLRQEKDILANSDNSRIKNKDEDHARGLANNGNKLLEYEKMIESLEADVMKLKKENETLLNRKDEVPNTTKTEVNHATATENDRQKIHEYERQLEQLEAEVITLRQEKDRLANRHNEVPYTTTSEKNYATNLTSDRKKIHEYERNVAPLEADVIKLREEKDALLNRLSQIGVIKLIENNPNVKDLSDENEPDKVAEQLSEIYDTEWTDAYETLTKRQFNEEVVSLKQLLDVLKDTYTICVSSTQEKTEALKEAISNYLGLLERDRTDPDLKETKRRLQEHRKTMLERNIINIEEKVRNLLKMKLEKEIFQCLADYIKKCVIVCCKMCMKEPPVYLDFGEWKSEDEPPANMPFDKSKFMTYTKSGDFIEYVVWPAVYLYEEGPLLRKGVAQGFR